MNLNNQKKKLSDVVNFCSILLDTPFAIECKNYLDSRISCQTQKEYDFGFFPSIKNIDLIKSDFSLDSLNDLGLSYTTNYSATSNPVTSIHLFFENHPLVMPYRNQYNEIIGIVGRTLLSNEQMKQKNIAKYKNTIFKKGNYLFNLNKAKQSILDDDCVIVVEGQFDCIKAYECGIKNVVALGCAAMTMYQFSLLLRYSKNIFLLLDNDEAGLRGGNQIIAKFGKHAKINKILLPNIYKDLDEYLSNGEDKNKLLNYITT